MSRRSRRGRASAAEGVQTPMKPVEKSMLCNPCEEPIEYWLYDQETGPTR